MVGVRLEPDFRAEIEAWAAKQKDKPPLAEAIRRLIRRALTPPKRSKPRQAEKQKVGWMIALGWRSRAVKQG
jgi:hypothetical protein